MPSGRLVLAAAVVAAFLPATAFAQITITQAKVNAGGITAGDGPGFPVTISNPGSYILKGNLTVPDEHRDAIVITANHVTIDLNGYAILGVTDCLKSLNPCERAGSGDGIKTLVPRFNITVRNGTIQGMGSTGVRIQGDSHLIERLHVTSNGGGGIYVLQFGDVGSSVVQHNTVHRNRNIGIATSGGVITNNVVDVNTVGIQVEEGHGLVSHNVVTRNPQAAIRMTRTTGYLANVFSGNGTDLFGTPSPSGGYNLGQNLCDGQPCP